MQNPGDTESAADVGTVDVHDTDGICAADVKPADTTDVHVMNCGFQFGYAYSKTRTIIFCDDHIM